MRWRGRLNNDGQMSNDVNRAPEEERGNQGVGRLGAMSCPWEDA